MSLRGPITTIILAFVLLMFVLSITPEISDAVTDANITNTFVAAMLDVAGWLIPVGAIFALVLGVLKLLSGGKRG